jgi:addiction module HigA family antidote
MIPTHRAPSHPGEILLEEFLKPREMTQTKLAARTGMSMQRINTLIHEKRGVTADTAILLSKAFGTTPQFWLNLQATYDLWHAQRRLAKAAS